MAKSKSELGDTGLERVQVLLLVAMSQELTVVLRQLSKGKTEEVAFHRFINNSKVTPEGLVNYYYQTVPKSLSKRT
ncbi:MAG: hypothetical protein ACI9XO_002960 [Paraglaciecola sp.]|jgi:hypothetical protein